MIKIIGAAFVLISCSAIGFEFSRALLKRKSNLESIREAVLFLMSEIRFSKRNASDMFLEAAKNDYGIVSQIFENMSREIEKKSKSVGEAWRNELLKHEKLLCFSKEEIKKLSALLDDFGKSDIYNQQKILEHTEDAVSKMINVAAEQCNKNVKLYRSIGVMVGIFICVLFV